MSSPNCEKITGFTAAEFESDPELLNRIVHLSDIEIWQTHNSLSLKGEAVDPVQFRIITKSGDCRWMSHNCRPVMDHSGRFLGIRVSNSDITEKKKAEEERERLIRELQEALATVKTLGGLLPICSHCKKIRDDQGYWEQIEDYVSDHSNAMFTHSLCPECIEKHYGDVIHADDKKRRLNHDNLS